VSLYPEAAVLFAHCQSVSLSASNNLALFNNDPTQIIRAYLQDESLADMPKKRAESQCLNPRRVREEVDEDVEGRTDGGTDCFMLSDAEGDAESDTHYSIFSEGDDPDRFSDDSSVTDDEYDAGPEETGAIVWRHIAFYIVRSPVPGRPNILLAKITLLHTKGEDNKPRVHYFIIFKALPIMDTPIKSGEVQPEFEKARQIMTFWCRDP
jgi:hypothetical protein